MWLQAIQNLGDRRLLDLGAIARVVGAVDHAPTRHAVEVDRIQIEQVLAAG